MLWTALAIVSRLTVRVGRSLQREHLKNMNSGNSRFDCERNL